MSALLSRCPRSAPAWALFSRAVVRWHVRLRARCLRHLQRLMVGTRLKPPSLQRVDRALHATCCETQAAQWLLLLLLTQWQLFRFAVWGERTPSPSRGGWGAAPFTVRRPRCTHPPSTSHVRMLGWETRAQAWLGMGLVAAVRSCHPVQRRVRPVGCRRSLSGTLSVSCAPCQVRGTCKRVGWVGVEGGGGWVGVLSGACCRRQRTPPRLPPSLRLNWRHSAPPPRAHPLRVRQGTLRVGMTRAAMCPSMCTMPSSRNWAGPRHPLQRPRMGWGAAPRCLGLLRPLPLPRPSCVVRTRCWRLPSHTPQAHPWDPRRTRCSFAARPRATFNLHLVVRVPRL